MKLQGETWPADHYKPKIPKSIKEIGFFTDQVLYAAGIGLFPLDGQ
jgi:hypothetical protein